MRKTLVIALALVVAALAGPTLVGGANTAAAKTYKLSAAMDTKQVVTVKSQKWKAPASVAKGKGRLIGTFDSKTRKLTWQITYTGIGKPVIAIADVHVGPPGKFGAIIVRLCGPCRSGQRGVKQVGQSFVSSIASGNSWGTVITGEFPNGVIRGQIKAG